MRKQQNHEDTEPQDKYKACEQRGRASEGRRTPEWTEQEGDRRLHSTRVQLHNPGRLGSSLPLRVLLSCPCSLERTVHRGAREGDLSPEAVLTVGFPCVPV